jgi:hypothetical protein
MRRLAFAGLLLVSGCDPLYGVHRTAPLAAAPELICVERAIAQTDGVASVVYHARHEGKGLIHPTPWIYDFVWTGAPGSGISGSLQLIKTYDGHISYSNSRWQIGRPPPQSSIDATRPVMRAMERTVAARCGITELTEAVREDCPGVSCNPLPN